MATARTAEVPCPAGDAVATTAHGRRVPALIAADTPARDVAAAARLEDAVRHKPSSLVEGFSNPVS